MDKMMMTVAMIIIIYFASFMGVVFYRKQNKRQLILDTNRTLCYGKMQQKTEVIEFHHIHTHKHTK